MSDLDLALSQLRAAIDARPGLEDHVRSTPQWLKYMTTPVPAVREGVTDVLRVSGNRAILFSWDRTRRRLSTRYLDAPWRWSPGRDRTLRLVDSLRRRGRALTRRNWHELRFLYSRDGSLGLDRCRKVIGHVTSGGPVDHALVDAYLHLVMHETAAALWGTLPSDLVDLCRVVGGERPLDLERLHSLHLFGDLDNPAWVVQALGRAPILLHALDDWRLSMARRRRIARSLSKGRPIRPVVTEYLEAVHPGMTSRVRALSPTAFRSLLSLTCSRRDPFANLDALTGGVLAFDDFVAFLATYHDGRPRRAPLTEDEARSLNDGLSTWSRHVADGHPWKPDPSRGFCDYVAPAYALTRLGAPARIGSNLTDRRGRVVGLPEDAGDVLRSVGGAVRHLVALHAPDVWKADGPAVAKAMTESLAFPQGRNADAWVRIDAAWHAAIQGLRERARAILAPASAGSATDTYPHVWASPKTIDGVTVTPMLTREDYLREGREMRHCIGGHADWAVRGDVVAWSVSGPGDERSSASHRVSHDGRLEPEQHRGPDNAAPPPSHVAALRALVPPRAEAGSGLERLAAARKAAADRHHEPDLSRLPPEDREALSALWFEEIAPLLSPAARRMQPRDWVMAGIPDARSVVTQVTGKAGRSAAAALRRSEGVRLWRKVGDLPRDLLERLRG